MDLIVNGTTVKVDDATATHPLLWTLREKLNIKEVKFGCGVGACAACTVHVEGVATKSCQTATRDVVGKLVTTLAAAVDDPVVRAVQQAWYDLDVVQCGYCQPGQILAAAAYLRAKGQPNDEGIGSASV